jgi:transglutaminase-like putative cysteine protease
MSGSSIFKRLGLKPADGVDAIFAVALTLLGLVGFRYAFGQHEYMIVGCIAAVLGALVALVIVRFKLPGLFALALAGVVFLVVGAAVAIRDRTMAGFLPTPSGVTGLIDGTMSGWRRLLTTLPPSGSLGNLLAVPFLCGYLPVLVATLLARRTKWLGALLIPPGVVLALSVLFGARTPFSLAVQGAVFAAISIAWLAIRRSRERRVFLQTSGHKRLIGGAVMLGLIGASSFAVGPRLPFAAANSRYVLDRENPPFDPRQYGSPLNGYNKYLNGKLKDTVLFTVSGVTAETGQTFGRVRLATMDDYNGVVWEVNPQNGSQSYQFLRVGETVPTDAVGKPVTLTVTVGALPGVWVPDVGAVTGITWKTPGTRGADQRQAFRLSTYTQTAADPGGLTAGDSYVVHGLVEQADDALLRQDSIDKSLRTKVDAPVPDVLSAKAGEIIKNKTSAFDEAQAISEWFHKQGYYTTGNQDVAESPLSPGHSAARLASFLDGEAPVGSSEQYAAAMALMARKVGLPARVVMGFRVTPVGTDAVAVKGSDVDAWVEIPFLDSKGVTTWRSFDPTPRERPIKPPDQLTKQPLPKFESQDVPPPPLPPPPPGVVDVQSGKEKPVLAPKKPTEKLKAAPRSHVLLIAATAGIGTPVVVFAGFAGVVLLLKRRRRNRRQRAELASNRVAGGWNEYIDSARDIGLPVPDRGTRREAALMIGGGQTVTLAHHADVAVFGPDDPPPDAVDAYWDRVATARHELRSSLSAWGKLRASLSLTSLRSSR